MPWKMIGLIVLLVLFAAFATLNISNRADISLGFYVFEEVPIFLSLLVAFLAGAVAMIPFTFGPSLRKLKVKKEKQDAKKAREEAKKEKQAAKEKKLEDKNERRQVREMKKAKSPAPEAVQPLDAAALSTVGDTQEALPADNKKDAKKKKKKT